MVESDFEIKQNKNSANAKNKTPYNKIKLSIDDMLVDIFVLKFIKIKN